MTESREIYKSMHQRGMDVFIKYPYDSNIDLSLITTYRTLHSDDELELYLNGWDVVTTNHPETTVWEFTPPRVE